MRVTISPGRAVGIIEAPRSKSVAHRLLIMAGLAPGQSVITRVDPSDDLQATIDCLRALGAAVDYNDGTAVVTGTDPSRFPEGAVLRCRESGSTLRFLIPTALLSGKDITFTGKSSLFSRPLDVYRDLCRERDLRFDLTGSSLTVRGPLSPGEFLVPGDISSQFITGLLLALPLLDGDSRIRLLPPVESRPYVDLTLDALQKNGVSVSSAGDTLFIGGRQSYTPLRSIVEGDWSGAAFFLALSRLGGDVGVLGLPRHTHQADRVCPGVFDALTASQTTVDLSDHPDLGPVAMAMAAALNGATFTGVRRLRFKESDRCAAMAEELAKFGVECRMSENTMTICAAPLRRPDQPLSAHSDHRIAMALSILATVTGADLDGAEAAGKSMPDFYRLLQKLGIEVIIHDDR